MNALYFRENQGASQVRANILYFRKKQGVSQARVAEALNVSPNCVSKWETGKARPSLEHAIKLAEFFGVELGELFTKKVCS